MIVQLKRNATFPLLPLLFYGACAVLFFFALYLRVSVYNTITSDYTAFVSQWYAYLKNHGGFAALKYNFSNYNVPYLYLLLILTYLPVPQLIAIKSLSVFFDLVMALFVFLIVRLKYRNIYAAPCAALVMLYAPTIWINSAAWGQADAIYTAFCLGSLYFLLKGKPFWACIFFGLAFSFKLQAIFFFPLLLILLLRKKLPWQHLLLVPAVFLIMLVPAYIAGRDFSSLVSIYVNQTSNDNSGVGTFNSGGGQNNGSFGGQRFNNTNGSGVTVSSTPSSGTSGTTKINRGGPGGNNQGNGGGGFGGGSGNTTSSSSLTRNAPTWYQWVSGNSSDILKDIGIGLAGLFVALMGVLVWRSKQPLTPELILKIGLMFCLAIPFLLPNMHERYFFMADVISIIAVFYFPRLFYIALLMQLSSLLSYAPYMWNSTIVSLGFVALIVLAINLAAFTDLLMTLYPGLKKILVASVSTTASEDTAINDAVPVEMK